MQFKENLAKTYPQDKCSSTPYIISLATEYFINSHCVKSIRIRIFSGLYVAAFGLNMEICSENLRIQSECRKIRTRKTYFEYELTQELTYFFRQNC